MYEHYFGLREKPFSVRPDPDFLYLSAQHSMAFAMLQYGLMNESGFIVVTGEIGCGKTILVRRLLNHHEQDALIGLISNTSKFHGQILERVMMAFGLDFEDASHTTQYARLVDFLVREYAKLRHVVLIVDEAQNLSTDALEELRTLSNINADKDQLIQLIFLGQPELVDTLRQPNMRQFTQRIAIHYHLEPLTESYTRKYLHHRLQVAGGKATLFTDEACSIVYRMSRGIPRLINRYCDTALLYAYGESKTQVDAELVTRVAQEINKGGLSGLSEVPTSILNNLTPRTGEIAAEQEVKTSDQPPRAERNLAGNNAETSVTAEPILTLDRTRTESRGEAPNAPIAAGRGAVSPKLPATNQARSNTSAEGPPTNAKAPKPTPNASREDPADLTSPARGGLGTAKSDATNTRTTTPNRTPQKESNTDRKVKRRFWIFV